MAEISIRNLKKSYGSYTVMQAVSFDIAEGEFVVLVGPSGCGKSTLLRMIAGLEDISGGEILIDGKTVNDVPAKDRGIAMVFQNYALYPHMNVEQNMGFSLRIEGHKKQEIRERVAEVARILELTPLLHRKPRQLSGGQRQRVAMGRAIVRDPSIFLFDEPLSNLDAQLRVQMRAEVVAMHMRYKTTTVYVTHDQIEAMTMADRIVVMRQGHVEQIGRPLDLFDAPANVFVARFIGSPQMNLMDGRIEIRDGQPCFVAGDWVVPLDGKYDVDAGRAVILGFRPNRILLANGDEDGATSAVVSLLEVTGTETMVTLTLLERKVLAVFNERISAKFGETISVRLDASELHIFDQETEVRL